MKKLKDLLINKIAEKDEDEELEVYDADTFDNRIHVMYFQKSGKRMTTPPKGMVDIEQATKAVTE